MITISKDNKELNGKNPEDKDNKEPHGKNPEDKDSNETNDKINLKDKDTVELTKYIDNIKSLEELELLVQDNAEVFSHEKAAEYYLACLENHGVSVKELYKAITSITVAGKTLINRSYISHFLASRKTLSRDNLFILSIFGKLTTDEVSTLLKYANSRGFYAKDERDVFIKYIFDIRDNPKYQSPEVLYEKSETFLAKENLKPLCNKRPMPKPDEYKPQLLYDDKETVMLDKEALEIESLDDLYMFMEENSDVISSEEVNKYKKVSAYLLERVAEVGLSPKEYVDRIFSQYVIEQSSLYHMFNIYGKSNTVKGFSRNSIIAFGIIGELSLEEINSALRKNNSNPLYVRNWRDLYLMYAIKHNFTYDEIEEWLYRKGLEPLNKNV